MKLNYLFFVLVTLLMLTTPSRAQVTPPPPPLTNGGPAESNGMKHLNVSLSVNGLTVHPSELPASPVMMTSGWGKDFTDEKFSVLEDVYFNGQYGWLPDSVFDSLPADGAIWIKRTGATQPEDAEFHVYEGGNMREGMDAWTMQEVYSSDGALWRWDGAMQHDYYTANTPGDYSMSFEVFVGDQDGTPLGGFTSAETTLYFRVVPEPNGIGLLGLLTMIPLLRHKKSS